MRPVHQTIHGPHGNCYEACLASLLEIELADVPSFEGPAWVKQLRGWLEPRGWQVGFLPGGPAPTGEAIASQTTIDGSLHAVLRRDGLIVHDPSPRPYGRHCDPVQLWTLLRRLSS